jgi:hypothetical protein
LRTLEKRVVAAENGLATANAGLDRLNPLVRELALVRASLALLASRRDGRASGWYSIGEAERLLLLYLTDGLSLSPSGRAVQQGELEAQPTDETPEGGWSHEERLAAAGIGASDGPRTRNVHGERLSWSARGRRDRQPLPRGSWPGAAGLARRADLQRALRRLPRQRAEVLFLRAVADLEFSEVAACLGVSKQAVQKMYKKALADLRDTLNGVPLGIRKRDETVSCLDEIAALEARVRELEQATMRRPVLTRQLRGATARLAVLRPRLEQARAEVSALILNEEQVLRALEAELAHSSATAA